MKHLFFAACLFISASAFANRPPDVTEKVLKAFNETFGSATDVSWYEMPNSYEAKFVQDDIQTRVTFDTNGNIIKSIRYYGQEKLPPMIVSKLKKRYEDKKIFGVTEVSSENDISYYVMLEGAKDWVRVKSDGYGNLQVVEKLKKAE